jgi:arylsulfatase A-like enzyme
MSTFQTDRLIEWIDAQPGAWFAHSSYLRPHPPYCAAGRFASMYDPASLPDPIPPAGPEDRHPLHQTMLGLKRSAAPTDQAALRNLRAQYFGMISEVDAQLGRLWDHLQVTGAWEETLIVVTADHGEQLGDQGLIGKLAFFESSYHIVGIVRDPRRPTAHGSVVEAFTENVDILPTIAEALGEEIPRQCDGVALSGWLAGDAPEEWRESAHYEFDWRDVYLRRGGRGPELERYHVAALRTAGAAYVQFGDGSWKCFDLDADPTWRTEITDPVRVLPLAQQMLIWRATHGDRTMTEILLEPERQRTG